MTIAQTHHGSNSWIILSNLMTANKREANPQTHANNKTVKTIKLFHPENEDEFFFISLKYKNNDKIS